MPSGYIKGKPDPEFWLRQIRMGTEFRKKFTHESQWNTWRDYYRGNWVSGVIPSNLYFRMVRTIVPRIYFRNPSVSIQASQPGIMPMAFAKVLESVDNKLIRQMRMKKQIKKMVQDTWMWGSSFGKLGFGAEYVPTPILGEITERPESNSGEIFEYNSRVMKQMPWFSRIKTGNFILPANAESIESARWAAEWVRRPIDDVQADPTFKHVKNLRVGSNNKTQVDMPTKNTVDDGQDMIDLIEIRDKKLGMVFVMAPSATDKILFQEDDFFQEDGGFNWHMLVFNEDDDVAWGVPDAHILDPQQRELNEIRTQQMKHRRLSLVRFLVKIGGMDDDEAAKLVSETVGPVIKVKDSPDSVIKVLPPIDIPNGLIQAESIVLQDVREQQGFGRNQFGEFSEGKSKRTTATEAAIVRSASEIRVDERRDMTADMLTDVVDSMHSVIFRHWTQEEVINVAGPQGMPLWVRFRPDVLKAGSYETKIDPDTSIPQTKELREAKAMALYERLKSNPLIDPLKLTQYLLHEMEGVQFSSMLRGDFQGQGSQQRPMDLGQLGKLLGQAPEVAGLISGPQGQPVAEQ